MGLMFGEQDDIQCLANTSIVGPTGFNLCLAQKVSTLFVGAGVRVQQEYVLKVDDKSYLPVTREQLEGLQAEGKLPTPLPPIHVSAFQYAFGYSLWWLIAIIGLVAIVQKLFGKLQPFLKANVAPVTGPPVVRTEWDRWLFLRVEEELLPAEKQQHLALAQNFPPMQAPLTGAESYFLALTDRRLLVFEAVRGRASLKREAHVLRTFARSDITTAMLEPNLAVRFTFTSGEAMLFWLPASQRQFTNQWLFARDVPKLLRPLAQSA